MDSIGIRGGPWCFICYDKHGNIKWEEVVPKNLVVNAGLNKLLDVGLVGSTAVATWYCGLIGTGETIASGDTMASHAGWTEVTAYGTAARAAFTFVRTNQTVSNSAATISYAINTAASIAGAFVSSDSTKSGTTGTLLAGVAFASGDKGMSDGDTLTVTYAITASDA